MTRMTDARWNEMKAGRWNLLDQKEVMAELDRSRMAENELLMAFPPSKKALPTPKQDHYQATADRRSGKTTALINAAIDYALEGRSVVFVNHCNAASEHAKVIFKHLCEKRGLINQGPLLPIRFESASHKSFRHCANAVILDMNEVPHLTSNKTPQANPKVCECGSAKAKLPTHSSWCPVGGK